MKSSSIMKVCVLFRKFIKKNNSSHTPNDMYELQ